MMKEISILDIENIKIGQTENPVGGTGCTVIVCEKGMPAGLDVRGGGPASRETELLKPVANADRVHAVVFGGGSAFGLDAAGGVMQYLEENNIGLDVGVTKVPLIVQSDIFDLNVADKNCRPDKKMGYEACKMAFSNHYQDGCLGAGTGATVGKLMGMAHAMKSGIGSYAIQLGKLKIGAIVVVNAVGDIYDYHNGQKIAGLLADDKKTLLPTDQIIYQNYEVATNTTIGAIITNAKFTKTQLCKLSSMTHNGYARAIKPVHTSGDGDNIYALSVGDVDANLDMVGTLAADIMSEAIIRAIKHATSAYGLTSYQDLKKE